MQITIESIARMLLDMNISFSYHITFQGKTLSVKKNGDIKPFYILYDLKRLDAFTEKHEPIELPDLIKSLNQVLLRLCP